MEREKKRIDIYASGLCYSSVCADREMPLSEITEILNSENPTGINTRWELSDEDFRCGESNPCRCTEDDSRVHYLFSC
jgi:hypothetical protein